jgi:ubiquinone biosynthesis protein
MIDPGLLTKLLAALTPAQVELLVSAFAGSASTARRVKVVETLLRQSGPVWRGEIGQWVADLLGVEQLVPDAYSRWRPLVHDSMAFVASHISDRRLAPKIVEQLELPPRTTIEERLVILIAKTPGLQKLGQVLARTRRLTPSLRRELQKLENGIADMDASEVRGILDRQLGAVLRAYRVETAANLLSEGSVSAVLEFTWYNPSSGRRERGVFKVIKPHVPLCYAEDLSLLQQLAEFLASREYGFASRDVAEMLDEVRLLLQHEVDFRREQVTLAEVARVYPREGSHAPRPIPALCTDCVTAMTAEYGVKVTDAFRQAPLWRRRVASQIVEALIAGPIFSDQDDALFHADPHAGNLLYDEDRQELIVLDWALTGRLNREERRQVVRLMIAMTFRDAHGVRTAIHALNRGAEAFQPWHTAVIDSVVDRFFDELPHACSLNAIDAMRLLDTIGLEGVRFPPELVLIRKVLFTLDGVLHDIAGGDVRIDAVVARDFLARLLKGLGRLPSPFTLADYLAMQASAWYYGTGFWAWEARRPLRT